MIYNAIYGYSALAGTSTIYENGIIDVRLGYNGASVFMGSYLVDNVIPSTPVNGQATIGGIATDASQSVFRTSLSHNFYSPITYADMFSDQSFTLSNLNVSGDAGFTFYRSGTSDFGGDRFEIYNTENVTLNTPSTRNIYARFLMQSDVYAGNDRWFRMRFRRSDDTTDSGDDSNIEL